MKDVVELNEANFETEVNHSSQAVLVDFWAEGCGPCKMLGPVLEDVAAELSGRIKIAKVNVNDNPGLAVRFGIRSVPTLLYFVGGQLRDKTVGLLTKQALTSKLEKLAVAA